MKLTFLAFILCFSLIIIIKCIWARTIPTDPGIFNGPEIFLTVHPQLLETKKELESSFTDRRFVLNWFSLKIAESDNYVGLFDQDPFQIQTESELKKSALHLVQVHSSEGQEVTNTSYERKGNFSALESEKCTKHWIAFISEGKVVASNCFQIHPKWMHELSSEIGNRPLHSLLIPGTHNSGSYNTTPSKNILSSYVLCQEDSVYEQLVHGIRYLDIRVGHYPDTQEQFWINHNFFRIRPIITIFEDLKRFVQETQEIVFLDFHRFPVGFNDTIHKIFLKLIYKELENHLAPSSLTVANATPNDFWKINKTIIVGYEHGIATERKIKDILWPQVDHAWANTNEINKLEKYLKQAHQERGCRKQFYAAMGQMTFTFEDIFSRPDYGIRGFSAVSNPKITKWYRNVEWYSKTMIMASDFYLGNNFIEMAIKVNKNARVCHI